ncbi:MAG: metallophosphoesterase family protein [Nevskia sp.]
MSARAVSIGLISDTHGLLRPEALRALQGSDRILHAGDIGDPAILERLAQLAPVTAVRGNNDRAAAYAALPETAQLVIAGFAIELIHDVKALDPASHRQVVVSGHSHRPLIERRGGVLYLNPGSAGPRRFRLPVSVGRLRIAHGELHPEWLSLEIAASA